MIIVRNSGIIILARLFRTFAVPVADETYAARHWHLDIRIIYASANQSLRKIIHIDMDAFFASIEQRDNPQYRGRPVAVGHAGDRGVVAAASYEARRYGVRSAMPSKTALRKCPHLIFAPSRFEVYKEVSHRIMSIFLDYTDLVEPLSLDEAFIDVTDNHKEMKSATDIAVEIKRRIREETQLTASAGVSYNKFLAKIASDYNKPDGLFVIRPRDAQTFVADLRVEQFFGVGRVTADKMHSMGIYTGADLRRKSEQELIAHFGKMGHIFYTYARGVDERLVISDRIRKSIGAENTFTNNLSEREELIVHMRDIAETVWQRTSKRDFKGRTVTLKVKYADFTQVTRSFTVPAAVEDFELFWNTAVQLLAQIKLEEKSVRLLGLTISNIEEQRMMSARQLTFDFDKYEKQV